VFKQAFSCDMRIITYSDLHLEFGSGWILPPALNGDVMVMAGHIVCGSGRNSPLCCFASCAWLTSIPPYFAFQA
jgi:hypothetical protein